VEQLEYAKTKNPAIAAIPFFLVSSAQSGPMLKPYVDSKQADVMVNGLNDAVKYEFVNNSRPGTARVYWDAFGIGILMAVLAIVIGNIWNLYLKKKAERVDEEQG
jgi:hypothetical protein